MKTKTKTKTKSLFTVAALALTAVCAPILFGQESNEKAAPAAAKSEKPMRIFMFSSKPSPEAWQFMKKNPKIAPIEQAAVKLGKKPLAQQAYRLVLLGVTSLAEIQRVLKEQP